MAPMEHTNTQHHLLAAAKKLHHGYCQRVRMRVICYTHPAWDDLTDMERQEFIDLARHIHNTRGDPQQLCAIYTMEPTTKNLDYFTARVKETGYTPHTRKEHQ